MIRYTICLLLLISNIAHSKEPPDRIVKLYSLENSSCQDWNESKVNQEARMAQYIWFRGFVSGQNFGLSEYQVGTTKMLSADEFFEYVAAKCKENPSYILALIARNFVADNLEDLSIPKK